MVKAEKVNFEIDDSLNIVEKMKIFQRQMSGNFTYRKHICY